MPYALNDTISKSPIEGGIEISEQQFAAAKEAKFSGLETTVLAGSLVIRDPAPSPDHVWDNGEWVLPPQPEPEPTDPLTLTLTKRQVVAALILGSGQTDPEGMVEAAIASISDATQRALALTDWRYAPYYDRAHPLFNDPAILTATGLSASQIDDLWTLGTTLPA